MSFIGKYLKIKKTKKKKRSVTRQSQGFIQSREHLSSSKLVEELNSSCHVLTLKPLTTEDVGTDQSVHT